MHMLVKNHLSTTKIKAKNLFFFPEDIKNYLHMPKKKIVVGNGHNNIYTYIQVFDIHFTYGHTKMIIYIYINKNCICIYITNV